MAAVLLGLANTDFHADPAWEPVPKLNPYAYPEASSAPKVSAARTAAQQRIWRALAAMFPPTCLNAWLIGGPTPTSLAISTGIPRIILLAGLFSLSGFGLVALLEAISRPLRSSFAQHVAGKEWLEVLWHRTARLAAMAMLGAQSTWFGSSPSSGPHAAASSPA